MQDIMLMSKDGADLTRESAKTLVVGSMSLSAWLCLLPWTLSIGAVKSIIRLEIYIAKNILLFFFPDLKEQVVTSKTIMTNAIQEAFTPFFGSLKTFVVR